MKNTFPCYVDQYAKNASIVLYSKKTVSQTVLLG